MGSKKHKKESKKKKHRSRSRSPLEGEERERKRHKKHKDRKKDRSPDVEEVPVDSHLLLNKELEEDVLQSKSRSRSGSRDRRARAERTRDRDRADREKTTEKERSPVQASSSNQESLSIEETNRIRAKLGLKPLEVAEKPTEDGKYKDDLGEFYHKPAANISAQKKTEKIREKLDERKEQRKMEQKLKTTLLAAGSDDEDAAAWVKKSREIDQQKKEAAKRAAMLDEMDQVFGVSALVEEEAAATRAHAYSGAQLRGLRVAHDIEQVSDSGGLVLTLADREVLAEDAEDVLVNVNLLDDDRYRKNQEELKKARKGYQAYDDEAEVAAAALGLRKSVLDKYDDEIDKERREKSRGFIIGDDAAIEAKRFRDMMRNAAMSSKRMESLALPPLTLAKDYLDPSELKFKKIKKKGKMRRKPKSEPIDVDDYDPSTAPLDTDDTEVKPEVVGGAPEGDEDEVEPDGELQLALARGRRLRQQMKAHLKVEEILERVKEESPQRETEAGAMVLDATAEFCRTLGDIPTYGLAGNRDQQADDLDFEMEEGVAGGAAADEAAGAWSRVDVLNDKPPDIAAGSSVALDAEPALDGGVAGALRLALSKGYLEKAGTGPTPRPLPMHLLSQHYSIEDKSHSEEDKHSKRERHYAGPLHEFREKRNFKPSIKLEYVDDDGRPLCPKEAFRYLSHKFHGKGPGKNKQEKRIKKAVQEGLMKKMSSTDTPLNTLAMLQEKQKETHSPYVVLQGNRKDGAP